MKKILPVIMLSLMVLPLLASATTDPTLLICTMFQKIKTIVAAVGFGLAVIFIIVGGIKYMTSQGDDEKATSARKMIVNALIGIAIILVATFILTVVEGFVIGAGFQINPFGNPCGTY